MEITDLTDRRTKAATGYATCPCGEAWYELRAPGTTTPHGAVSLAEDRQSITGYAGRPHCIACGTPA